MKKQFLKSYGKLTRIFLLIVVTVCFVSIDMVIAEDTEIRSLTEEEIAEQRALEPELMPMMEVEDFDVRLQESSESSVYGVSRGATADRYSMRGFDDGSGNVIDAASYVSKVAVRDQSSSELCWAFTAATVAEIAYYHENQNAANIDLSPKRFGYFFYNRVNDPLGNTAYDKNNALNYNYVERGGNNIFSMQALANWGGMAAETEAFNVTANSYNVATAYNNSIVLESAEVLDSRDEVKQAIVDHGAVMASLYYDPRYLSNTTADAYLCNQTGNNHAVTIIGWDDAFSASYFNSDSGVTTDKNGAWIVQNSWGPNWRYHGGCFYVSYEDPSLINFISLDVQSADTYDYNYQYDGNAYPAAYAFSTDGTAEVQTAGDMVANIFTVPESTAAQQLKAIGFTTWDESEVQYTVDVYTNVTNGNPTSGNKKCSFGVTVDNIGYHAYTLDSPVSLTPGMKYAIVITAKTDGALFCYETADTLSWIDFDCGTAAGQSYIKLISNNTWYDLHNENMSVRIKGFTTVSGSATDRVFGSGRAVRCYGSDRYITSQEVAKCLKTSLGISKFKNIIVASGANYPDALSGSYLAKVKEAPILLLDKSKEASVKSYIASNLQQGGTVYILGGTGAVSSSFQRNLETSGYKVTRLGGNTRFDTNLKILEAAGVTDEDILICSANGYADSLSASAVGKPVMIVGNSLTPKQQSYLKGLKGDRFYIIGGTGAVNNIVYNQVKQYGSSVNRIFGQTRFETSTAVANTFFKKGSTDTAVLAYAHDFPDGLSGGPLALSVNGPLLLTDNSKVSVARSCMKNLGINKAVVLGGPTLISNSAVNMMLQ